MLRVMQIVPLLQIEPEIRTIPAQLPEPQGLGFLIWIKRLPEHNPCHCNFERNVDIKPVGEADEF